MRLERARVAWPRLRGLTLAALLSGGSLSACLVRGDAGESEPCLPSQSTCVVSGRPRCVDPASDRAHCGACDSVCAAGDVCVQGRCAATQCAEGERRCEGEALLECARDRTRFERAQCERGAHCEGAGRCVDNVATWPDNWITSESDAPSAQSVEPWSSWGGDCGTRQLAVIDGEPVYASTSDRTLHARPVPWPTEGAWAIEARLRWHREGTVLVMVGSYAALGQGVAGWIEQLQIVRDAVSTATLGAVPQLQTARATPELWHTIRFEADTASARARWTIDGRVVVERGMLPIEAFGPYLVIAGFGECATNVLNVGAVSVQRGGL